MSLSADSLYSSTLAKITKLRTDINNECNAYSKNTLESNKAYNYYSSELDAISKRKERDIENFESSINQKIESLQATANQKIENIQTTLKQTIDTLQAIANQKIENCETTLKQNVDTLQAQLEVKKQGIIDKSKTLSEDYLKKCSDIEANHKKPNSKAFKIKEEELADLERKLVFYAEKCDEDLKIRQQVRQEEFRIEKLNAERKEALERAEALERFHAERERARLEDEKRWAKQKEEAKQNPPTIVPVHSCYGVAPVIKVKIQRKPLNSRNINELTRDEIDELELTSLTPEEFDSVADRSEYLDNNKVESKELSKEYLADKRKERKVAKKIKIQKSEKAIEVS